MGATIRIAVLAQTAKARAGVKGLGEDLGGLGTRAKDTGSKVKASFAKIGTAAKAGAATAGLAAGSALAAGALTGFQQEKLQAKLGVQLGLGKAEAEKLGKTTGKIYAAGFGEDLGQVNQAVKSVFQNIGKGGTAWTEDITKKVLTVSDAFDQDLGKTTAAVGQLMKTGLAKNATEALDVITVGFQSGADKAEDLLDTYNEYGTQFRELGVTGKQATGLLSQGLKAGARDADKVADALKEFTIRAKDGSKTTAEGFKALGLSGKTMAADIAKGGPKANAALDKTLDRLRAVKDPVKRSQIAVKLFGTQAEDLGDALYALDPSQAVESLGKVGGAAKDAVSSMDETQAQKIERFKRKVTQGFTDAAASAIEFGETNQKWLMPIAGSVAAVGGAILVANAATKAWQATQIVIKGVTATWTAAQWLLNAALTANPIGIVIVLVAAFVAAIVIAWKKSDTFREVVTNAFRKVGEGAGWLWDKIVAAKDGIVGAWHTTQTKFSDGWNWIDRKVIKPFNRGIDDMQVGFKRGTDAIGKGWNEIQEAAKKPVRFTVNTVIGGLVSQFNKISGKVGIPALPVPHVNFARGGRIYGPGTGTSDDVPIRASAGEWIIREKAAKKLGPRLMEKINNADRLDVAGDIGTAVVRRYASGGEIGGAAAGRVAATRGWLPSVDPLPYVWGGVGPRGYDCSGLVGEVWARLTGRSSYRRYMTTSTILSDPRGLGLAPGPGLYSIGVSSTHTAGNLAGLGFEAASSRSGIKIGGAAKSPASFPRVYHLASLGTAGADAGGDSGWWPLGWVKSAAKAATKSLLGPWLRTLGDMGIVGDLGIGATKKIMGGIFDTGGYLQPGYTLAYNGTGRPEKVIPPGGDTPPVRITLTFEASGDPLVDVMFEELKKRIRVEGGGDVQVALGTGDAR